MLRKENFFNKGLVWRVLFLGILWWLLTGNAYQSWVIGIPVILMGLIAIAYLPPFPSFRLSPSGTLYFILFFMKQSLLAGFDVAGRAVHPKLPLDPCAIPYSYRLRNELAVIFFIHSISLLPGTLSVSLKTDQILVHALDKNYPLKDNLNLLETKVANMFCEKIA